MRKELKGQISWRDENVRGRYIRVVFDGMEVVGVRALNTEEGWIELVERDSKGRLVSKGEELSIIRKFGSVQAYDEGQIDD